MEEGVSWRSGGGFGVEADEALDGGSKVVG